MSRATSRPVTTSEAKSEEPKKPSSLRPMAKVSATKSNSGAVTRRRQAAMKSSDKPAALTAPPASPPSGKAAKNTEIFKKPPKRAATTPAAPVDHISPQRAAETLSSTSNTRGTTPESKIPSSSPTLGTVSKRKVPITPSPTPPVGGGKGNVYASLGSDPDPVAPIRYQSQSPNPVASEGSGEIPIEANPPREASEPSDDSKPNASAKPRKTPTGTNPRRVARKIRRMRRRISTPPAEEGDAPSAAAAAATTTTATTITTTTTAAAATTVTTTTTTTTSQSQPVERTSPPDYSQAPRRSSRLAGLPDFSWVDGRRVASHRPTPGSARIENDRAARRNALEKIKKSRAARSTTAASSGKGKGEPVGDDEDPAAAPVEVAKEKSAAKPPPAGSKKAGPEKGVKSGRVGKPNRKTDYSRFFKS